MFRQQTYCNSLNCTLHYYKKTLIDLMMSSVKCTNMFFRWKRMFSGSFQYYYFFKNRKKRVVSVFCFTGNGDEKEISTLVLFCFLRLLGWLETTSYSNIGIDSRYRRMCCCCCHKYRVSGRDISLRLALLQVSHLDKRERGSRRKCRNWFSRKQSSK